jgi:hypothetical protein
MITREQIMVALLARIATVCGANFATYSRRFQTYTDLINMISIGSGDVPAFPALYLYDGIGFGEGGKDHWDRKAGQGAQVIRTINRTVVFYALKPSANTPTGADITVPGAIALNNLTEVVESAFAVDDYQRNTMTLGGLVAHCWIEGIGEMIPGDIDPTGLTMQTIPVKILIP